MTKKIKIKVTKKSLRKRSSNWALDLFRVRKKIKIIFTFNLNGGGDSDMYQKLIKK